MLKTTLICLLSLAVASPAQASVQVGHFAVDVLPSTSPGRAPVLYLVPGAGVSGPQAIEQLALASSPIRDEANIVVATELDGDLAGFNFVTDYFDGSKPLDSEFVEQVMRHAESRLAVRHGARAIAGYSAGGYSATAIASRHPGLFRAVGSFSGVVDIGGESAADRLAVLAPNAVSGDGALLSRWGDPVTAEDNWHAQNPTDLAARLAGVSAVYIAAGDGTPTSRDEALAELSPSLVPQVVAELQVSKMTRRYDAALTRAGVAHTYRPHHGLHRPEHWREDLGRFWPLARSVLLPGDPSE